MVCLTTIAPLLLTPIALVSSCLRPGLMVFKTILHSSCCSDLLKVGHCLAIWQLQLQTFGLCDLIVKLTSTECLAAGTGQTACQFAQKVWNAQQAGAQAVSR